MGDNKDKSDYLEAALEIADKAAEMIKDNFSMEPIINWKDDNTPVTQTDVAINRMVIDVINSKFPEHKILGEEEKDLNHETEHTWVCDPIDGTFPYSHGYQTSTFSLALVQDGKPIVGVVAVPFQGQVFHAQLGQGAFLNNEQIHVSAARELSGQGVSFEGPEWCGQLFTNLQLEGAYALSQASFVFGAKTVPTGHLAGSVFNWNFPWDCAAIKVIVEEAGGKTSDFDGNDQRYDQTLNGFIASNGLVHDQLIELVQKSIKEFKESGKESRWVK